MINQSERIMGAHRGWWKAEPASRSRLAALETFGLRFERLDDFNVRVEGSYLLNLALSYWRAEDNSCHGYLVSALDAEIKRTKIIEPLVPSTRELVLAIGKRKQESENPAPDRDSAPGELEPIELHRCAESGAGVSSAMLRSTWP